MCHNVIVARIGPVEARLVLDSKWFKIIELSVGLTVGFNVMEMN